MSFRDFSSNFQRLEICFLGPDCLSGADDEDDSAVRKFEGTLFEGGWKQRVNAGGCRNYACKAFCDAPCAGFTLSSLTSPVGCSGVVQ